MTRDLMCASCVSTKSFALLIDASADCVRCEQQNTDGANALWECWAASYLRLVEGNSTALHAMFDHVWGQIQVNGGTDHSSSDGRVGIKPDDSFWHHGSQLQLTHYGQDFSSASMYFSAITSKTAGYQMPNSSYDAFAKLVLDGRKITSNREIYDRTSFAEMACL